MPEYLFTKQDIIDAFRLKFNYMFSGNYFDYTVIMDCCQLLNIEDFLTTDVFKFISCFHCIDFDLMTPEQIEKLKIICYALLENPPDTPKANELS